MPSGNLLTATNPSIAYTFSYDLTHRLTAVSDSRGLTLGYRYDLLGNRTQLTAPEGTVVAYGYDTASRLVALTHDDSAFTLTYNRVGRRTRAALPNGTTAAYAYDPTGQLTALTHKDATGTVLQRTTYTYNAVGNRTTKVDQFGRSDYTYDAGHRLQEAATPVPSQPLEAFTYDLLGNRLTSTENGMARFNAGNQLREDAHFLYQYDVNGNLRRQTAKVGGETTQYVYDVERHLVRVVASTGMTVRYLYDALGRRIREGRHRRRHDSDAVRLRPRRHSAGARWDQYRDRPVHPRPWHRRAAHAGAGRAAVCLPCRWRRYPATGTPLMRNSVCIMCIIVHLSVLLYCRERH